MNRRAFLASVGLTPAFLDPSRLPAMEQLVRFAEGRRPHEVAADEDFWSGIRRAFTIDANQINLNSGSVSPAPRVVQDAVANGMAITNMSPSLWVDEMLGPQRELVRQRLAAAAGCDPEELAVTRNTSEGMQIVQNGIELQAGDEVLLTTQDYPRMITTWEQRARREGIVLKKLPFDSPPDDPMELVRLYERAITPRTRVLHFSHVTYTAGQIFPARELCELARARGIWSMVDGAHAFAHFPFRLDELGCDCYATSLHKWLTAPVGTGFLYVRRERIGEIWEMQAAPPSMQDNIRKFEQIGTFPVAIPNAIGAAVDFLQALGIERKAARLRYLRRHWMQAIADVPGVRFYTSLDDTQAGALATISVDGWGANDLTQRLLDDFFIHVRPRFVPGEWEGIRVTPNVFSTIEEVDAFAHAIRTIADG